MSSITVNGSALGNSLTNFLCASDLQPGDEPSYQACKVILLYHPLGQKMAEGPVAVAQSQSREIKVDAGSASDDVKKAFREEWDALGATKIIRNLKRTSRAYGAASVAMLAQAVPPERPIDPKSLPGLKLAFNVFDPLNTAGSLVLNQMPNAFDFQKLAEGESIKVQGVSYHPSRTVTVLNGQPVYIGWTASAFGYVGQSVFQRALFPLKSFIQTMRTDDMVSRKAGVLVTKQKTAGSIIDNIMVAVASFKRSVVGDAEVGNVISVGVDEDVTTLNMQNLDGAYGMARTNILKNIATSADMPAWFLENETLVSGFGEGVEDAKNIARYIDGLRAEMGPEYAYFDNIVMRRAWSPAFFERIKAKYKDEYGKIGYAQAFYRWANSFEAIWPNLLIEPESEKAKAEDVKAKTVIAVVETLAGQLDPENKARVLTWAADNLNESKTLFPVPLQLDAEAIEAHAEEQAKIGKQAQEEEPTEPKPFAATA